MPGEPAPVPDPSARVDVDTVIVGAGPAGLAVAGCLRVAGLEFELVEREANIAASWRRHYDRLHLHTVKSLSHLPYLPMPRDYPRYPSRDQLVAYLEGYAREFAIAPRLGVLVRGAQRRHGAWEVALANGALRARNLVIASGYNGAPHRPSWPGLSDFSGPVLHSSEYRSGASFAGQQVLVVGIGNSGGEIALDLHEAGARVTMCVRSPVHITPRDVNGLPAQVASLLLSGLPLRWADAVARVTRRLNYGDLSRYGLETPEGGAITRIVERGRIPLIDIGTVARIRAGEIAVIGAIERFDVDGVQLADGERRAFDAVVLATGYRASFDRFLEGAAAVSDDRGLPRVHGHEATVPGLFFIGFRNPPTGALREITIEAQRIAGEILRKERSPA